MALGAAACREAAEPRPPFTVHIDPTWVALLRGDSVALTSTVTDSQGDAVPNPDVTWATSDPSVVAVTTQGLVRAKGHGSATITATLNQSAGSAIVVVAPPVLVGAGDIAVCGTPTDEATAALLDTLSGVVFTAGDNAYPDGAPANFAQCYGPSWGRHRLRTRPTPGNHDYRTPFAAGYFTYFGPLAGEPGLGYYSWDFAGWHLVALNSNVPMAAGSPQEQWLQQDLAEHPATCTLAYWHHPRFSSAEHGSSTTSAALWQALYDANADVVVVGHDHTYERFAPQDPAGTADPARGIRQFVVGTGGARHYGFPTVLPNSEVRDSVTWGVLKLTLRPDGYDWRFLPAAGGSFSDSGTASCH